MALVLSTLYYVITGLQYWVTDYVQVVLAVPADEVYYFYSILCLSAPMLGVITGGFVFSSVGGYNSRKAFPLVLLIGFLAMGVSLPAPFASQKYVYYVLMWFLLYFGAMLVPTLTGIMLNSVTEERRTAANSLAQLWYNLLGYLPAPVVYGTVSTLGSDEVRSSRWAMGCLLYVTIPSAVFLLLGYRQSLKRPI